MKMIKWHSTWAWLALSVPLALAAAENRSPIIDKDDDAEVPQAVVMVVNGTCEFASDGVKFGKLKAQQVLYQNAVIRTGKAGVADVFFRRIGTTVRLQGDTELFLETMSRSAPNVSPRMTTLLGLRKGRIFIAVRALIPGSTLEIRNAAGRSVVEGGGIGRYIVTADGTQVADKAAAVPLKVVGDTGITLVPPGAVFRPKDGKMQPVEATEAVQTLMEFDRLQDLGDAGDRENAPPVKPAQ